MVEGVYPNPQALPQSAALTAPSEREPRKTIRSSIWSDMSPFKAATPVQVRCGSPAAMPLPWCLRLTGQDTSLCDSLRAALRAVARCIALRRLSSWQYGFESRRHHQRRTAADNSLRVSRLAAMAADCKSAGYPIVGSSPTWPTILKGRLPNGSRPTQLV